MMKPSTTFALSALGIMAILSLVALPSAERVLAQKKGVDGTRSNGVGAINPRTGGKQLFTTNDDGSGKNAHTGIGPNLPLHPLANISRTKHTDYHRALNLLKTHGFEGISRGRGATKPHGIGGPPIY